jgi:thiol:disulfide interchange protein
MAMKNTFFYGLAFLLGISTAAQAQTLGSKSLGAVVTTPHVRAELIAYAPEGIQAGKPLTVGLQIQHQPGWHTYWKNPGDSGLPTQLAWTLPAGLDAGETLWPTPKKITIGNLANYGYEGALLLPAPVQVAATFAAASTEIIVNLKAQWLVCKTECIPEEGEFSLKIPVRGSLAVHRTAFEAAKKTEPPLHTGAAQFAPQDKQLRLSIKNLPAPWRGKLLEAFPETTALTEPAAKQEQTWQQADWSAVIPLSSQRSTSPEQVTWLVKIAGGQSNPAVRVRATLEGAWPTALVAAPAAPSQALQAALDANLPLPTPRNTSSWMDASFWLAVMGALLGGLILNLMPCVLPVLAIKLLSFAPKKVVDKKSSVARIKIEETGMASVHHEHRLSFRSASGLFAVGVIGSFALLGGVLLILRAAGQSFGWGFQLQSPSMVLGLAVLFLLIGLNLFDAFDVRVLLPSKMANFHADNPSVDALASGMLAVLIATPCTAPFMGASLGLAVSLPALQALLIFIALGLGMALPFVAIAAVPAIGGWLLKALPKPGHWMLVLRHFLAWPVFATVLWLLWVYALQTSIQAAFAAMFSLLMLIALLWSLRLRKGWLRIAIASVFAACLLTSFILWQSPLASVTTEQKDAWQPWSVSVQQAARSKGQPVFVDFTAAWCITCQVNKSAVLNQPDMLALFKNKNVLLLRADWTRPDAAIATELSNLGRSGLPVYALYLPGNQPPLLLPELLTTSELQAALSVL